MGGVMGGLPCLSDTPQAVARIARCHKTGHCSKPRLGLADTKPDAAAALDLTETLLEVIDFRSFSNLWYWIMLAVAWSQASHWVLGVPFDMLLRARRQGAQATADFEDSVRVNVNRYLYIMRESGLWLVAFVAFFHSALLLLALAYRIEFALALELIVVPLTGVGVLSLFTARRIEAEGPTGEALFKVMVRHRFWTQVIGMVSIFVTASVGMFNLLYVPQF